MMIKNLTIVSLALLIVACSARNPLDYYVAETPTTMHDVDVISSAYPADQVQRGKYLAELLACGTCHTDGALVGKPDSQRVFAGSGIGIAYSNPLEHKYPGIAYPSNVTNALKTGLGTWTDDEIINVIRRGTDNHGKQHLAIMPWPGYSKLTLEDASALVAFLRSLKVIEHQVPDNVRPGEKATAPFVHFGVYSSKR
jgi:hypothetical protein